MAKYVILTDFQKVFVDGALGSARALAIYPAVKKKIFQRIDEGWHVVLTYDTHGPDYLNTMEGKNLPVIHGIEGTPEWELYGNLLEDIKAYMLAYKMKNKAPGEPFFDDEEDYGPLIVKKNNFGYAEWKYLIPDAEEIEVIGVCTDICVVSNVLILKAQFPEIPISVDANCCAGLTEEAHWAALRTMVSCQIYVYHGGVLWTPKA